MLYGCARHDLELAVSPDGIAVAGERDAYDRIYTPLTPRSECDEDTPQAALHIKALIESRSGAQQGLSRLYERQGVPILVQGKRPGSLGVAWATVAVGTHGLLLLQFLGFLALRRLVRGGLPSSFADEEELSDEGAGD